MGKLLTRHVQENRLAFLGLVYLMLITRVHIVDGLPRRSPDSHSPARTTVAARNYPPLRSLALDVNK